MTRSTPAPSGGALWAERTGAGSFTGRNERGASVSIGPAGQPETFTPGELLAIALAGCVGLSAEAPLVRRLGEDSAYLVGATRAKDDDDNRYPSVRVEVLLPAPPAGAPSPEPWREPAEWERMTRLVQRAVERHCTVSRTLEGEFHLELTLSAEPEQE